MEISSMEYWCKYGKAIRTLMSLIITIFMASTWPRWHTFLFTHKTELFRIYNFSPSIYLQRSTEHFAMITNMMALITLTTSILKASDSEVTVKMQCRKNTTSQKATEWSNNLIYSTRFQQKNDNSLKVECKVVFWRQTWRVIWMIWNLFRLLLRRTRQVSSTIHNWY